MDCSMQASLPFTISQSLCRLMSVELVMLSKHLILSLPSLLALNLSQHQGLSQRVSCLHQVAKVLEFQLQHQSFQLIFRVDFLLDWLVWYSCSPRDSQESFQHHSSKASILPCSTFFMVELSQLYMTSGKTIALTIGAFAIHGGNFSYSVQFSSVAQSCLTLCDPMNRSTPGFPVHHQLPEFTQTHIHGVSDAIQPSHPLSSPSPPAPNPSQHQSLFQWVNSSHEVATVLEL